MLYYDFLKKKRTMDLQMFAEDPPPGGGDSGGYSAQYVSDLRDENANWRKKLRAKEEEAEGLQKKIDDVNKTNKELQDQNDAFLVEARQVLGLDANTESQKVLEKVKEISSGSTETTKKAQEALRKSAFMTSATKQGIDPKVTEDAYKLADFNHVKVDLESMSVFPVDKDGKQVTKEDKPVTGLDSLVEEMVKEKPYLAGKKQTQIGGGSNPPGGGETPPEDGYGKQLAARKAEQVKSQGESSYFK